MGRRTGYFYFRRNAARNLRTYWARNDKIRNAQQVETEKQKK